MDSGQDRLLQFDRDLLSGKNICSSEGIFVNFPPSLKKPFQMKGLGLVICRQGNFQFSLNQKKHFAGAGESLFIPEDGEFQVLQESEDMEVRILIYQIEPIRDIMGNLVVSMYMYSRLTPEEPSCVWSTGEEEEILIENTETRDQPKNKENAMRQLRSILYDKELQHRMEEQAKVEAGKKKIEWGSQIRSYVFDDRRVKDHRTNYQTSDVNGVMDGKIDGFIKAYLMEFSDSEA